MIFVTLGTQEFQFDRLLRALDGLPGDEELVVQGGRSTFRPARAVWHDYLSFGETVEHVRRARVVVCHAGVGSVMTALEEGRRPVVVPRLREHGEAVDDHQLPFARRLASTGAVLLVEDLDALPEALAGPEPRSAGRRGGQRLALDLKAYLVDVVRR